MYQTQIEEFKSERVEVMIGYLQSHVIIFFLEDSQISGQDSRRQTAKNHEVFSVE